MAKPAGSITPGDGGLDAYDSASESDEPDHFTYAYFSFRLEYQPDHWMGDFYTNARHSVKPSFQHNIDATHAMRQRWKFSSDSFGNAELGLENVTSVGALWRNRNQTSPLKGEPCNAPMLTNSNTLPRYSVGQVEFQETTAGTGECEIVGVYIELLNEDEYTDPEPTGKLSVELTDRTTLRLYDKDQPASAWHAQWLLTHTLNKITYEARQCWSVPL